MKINKNLRLIVLFREILHDRFNLEEDKASEEEIIENVKKGIEFRGMNLWVLIFAIFIASIGLNVNSAAVIIGAMLISPLMGPIMGIGLGIGINDFELIKKSYKNLGVAVLISVITSTLYFLLTPLSDAQSELLARTTPTIWDVFIALFGGLAGIVAATRKSISNVIPGVAIATALMPPLCTAGFGLATGNLSYFFGAFYLFFINSVFISLATYIIVRFMKFHKKEFLDPLREVKVKRSIIAVVLITVIPSIIMAYNIVNRTLIEKNAQQFIQNELNFPNSQIISRKINFDSSRVKIEVFMLGSPVEASLLELAKQKLPKYKLKDAELVVKQGVSEGSKVDISALRAGVIEELYRKNEEILKNKDKQIQLLESQLALYSQNQFNIEEIAKEAKALFNSIAELSVQRSFVMNFKENKIDTLTIGYVKFSSPVSGTERRKLNNWLKERTNAEKFKLIIN
ncbi:Putative membrane protein [Ignavibacterium album JCM 16511]|uniref:Putative membrane protein n=1 Tax=Ignavibacterium album (strain DSM 19864 / JCM 16511 / NBRC 101810 / Mat9-16) TaxID=945713 RepID=I0AG30_IGNAJ|nr:TIGR00341 family protein [Ignavibacterium album]AFH47937.1 Putative membrane protein [Ignavibacterium album JCM 16511]